GVDTQGRLVAKPYRPDWLMNSDCIPESGIDGPPELRRCTEHVGAEGYVPGQYGTWQSLAQKEAVWTAITAPPGSTTLNALPTGAGKSLCFQIFPWLAPGITLVIVP